MRDNGLPLGWQYQIMGDLGSTYGGLSGKTSDDFGEGMPYIPYVNVFSNSRIDPKRMDYVRIADEDKQNEVAFGDIIFTISSETPQDVGTSSVVLDDLRTTYLNSFCFGFRLHDFNTLRPGFARYFFRGQVVRRTLWRLAQGATRYNLTKSELLKLRIPLPPGDEQDSIARYLSTWDDAIDKVNRLLCIKQRLKRGFMQKLLVGRHRLPCFGDDGMKEDLILGTVPASWDVLPLSQIVKKVTRRNTVGETHVLTASGQHGLVDQKDYFNRSVAGADLSGYYLLRNGEFAYNRSRMKGYTYGAIKRLDKYPQGVLSTLYLCFAIKSKDVDADFIKWYFEGGQMGRQLARVTPVGGRAHGLLNITSEDFYSIKIMLPPKDEQKAIAAVLNTAQREIDLLDSQLKAFKAQKKGLMQKLLTGQIRVKTSA